MHGDCGFKRHVIRNRHSRGHTFLVVIVCANTVVDFDGVGQCGGHCVADGRGHGVVHADIPAISKRHGNGHINRDRLCQRDAVSRHFAHADAVAGAIPVGVRLAVSHRGRVWLRHRLRRGVFVSLARCVGVGVGVSISAGVWLGGAVAVCVGVAHGVAHGDAQRVAERDPVEDRDRRGNGDAICVVVPGRRGDVAVGVGVALELGLFEPNGVRVEIKDGDA